MLLLQLAQAKPSLSSSEGWQRPLRSYCMKNWAGLANHLNNKLRKQWYFGPNRVEMEIRDSCSWGQTGNMAFQISLSCLCFITGFYLSFLNALSTQGQKTWCFGTLLYLEQPQKIRIQIISSLSCDYMANLHSQRSSAPRSALDRALTSNVNDELLFRNWQICVDQWLLKRKCHQRGQFSAVSSRSCQCLCWEN